MEKAKKAYLVRELQNLQSTCSPEHFYCENLSIAKRLATKSQIFQGSVLTISTPTGIRLAYKKGGKWINEDLRDY